MIVFCQANFWNLAVIMNEYQQEQWSALRQIADTIASIEAFAGEALRGEIRDYLQFREQLEVFLNQHFGRFCTQACFERQVSACCSKDGIITFWADHVINLYCSDNLQIEVLSSAIHRPLRQDKCIYLGTNGCLWKVRPLGCAMFLCDAVQRDVFKVQPSVERIWQGYSQKAKTYRWPDRPVLFDRLEQLFMAVGCRSALMYLNTSPGLLRVKKNSGRID
jgi:hypothetical protein